jgi:hypothetical protein
MQIVLHFWKKKDTSFLLPGFYKKITEDLLSKAHFSWYNNNFYQSTNYFYIKKIRSNFFWRFTKMHQIVIAVFMIYEEKKSERTLGREFFF